MHPSTQAILRHFTYEHLPTDPSDVGAAVREIAVMALGRISVDLFQPGRERRPVGSAGVDFAIPEFDYLVTRSGDQIGYAELADRFAAALDAELAELTAGLRKLLEAKDCMVRSALSARSPDA